MGDYGRATALFDESLALSRDLRDQGGMAYSLHGLGHVASSRSDYGQATTLYTESLALCQRVGDKVLAAKCLEGLARVAAAQGKLEQAVGYLGTAAAQRDAIGAPLLPTERTTHDRDVAAARTALGENRFAAAWAAGQALPLERAIVEALEASRSGHSHPASAL
jgi:tetratricopeptide (TPR) repeat protein